MPLTDRLRFLTTTSRQPELTRAPAPAPADRGAVLDAEALERLRELDPHGATGLIGKIVQAFETSTARLLPQMQNALAVQDRKSMQLVAHTLKSSSASIGALDLSRRCALLETEIQAGRLDGLDTGIDELCAEITTVLAALRRLPEPTAR